VSSRLYLILSILLAGDTTLSNGIRVYDLSKDANSGDAFEAIVGYRAEVHNQSSEAGTLSEVVASFLKLSPSVRAMAVAAYGAGGEIEFFSDLDHSGIRLKMPSWARPMVETSIAAFLSETPGKNPELVNRALDEVKFRIPAPAPASDVRSRIEEQFRVAMLGPDKPADLQTVRKETIENFFAENYGTDRAFVVMNASPSQALQAVENRKSTATDKVDEIPARASQPFYIPSDLDEGVVIVGVPTPPIYYQKWYAFLMLDQLIQQTLSPKPRTVFVPKLDSYFYRMEVSVPLGKTAEMTRAALYQELEQLVYVRSSDQELDAARRKAIQYLESEPVRRWFLSMGVDERRLEGMDWLRTFSADDMRVTARDVVEAKPVIAGYSPRVQSIRLETESLADIAARKANVAAVPTSAPRRDALPAVKIVPFPPHEDTKTAELPRVVLDSGVSIVASSVYAVFVAPDMFQVFEREPAANLIQTSFGAFRSNRILVMAPPNAMDRVKQSWAGFKGNAGDSTPVLIRGNITSADIPAMVVLKLLLDRRLIEAGLWNDVQVEVRASQGSTLTVKGNDTDRSLVQNWIREIADRLPPEEDIQWAREAAIHHLHELRPQLQSLMWEWNPDGVLSDIRTVPDTQIQEVARLYLK